MTAEPDQAAGVGPDGSAPGTTDPEPALARDELTAAIADPGDQPEVPPDGHLAGDNPDRQPGAPEEAVEQGSPSDGGDGARPAGRPAEAGDGRRPPRRPAAQRSQASRGFPRADRPGSVPAPQHHHLPGWVRRDFARARPAMADLLGLLQGEERAQFQRRIEELTDGINSGKFSLAFQYPQLVSDGRKRFESQREHLAEAQRLHRQLEAARRRAGERLRDATDLLGPEAAARLTRTLRQAGDHEAIAEIEAEVSRALSTARSTQTRRRDREIERTRDRIRRTLPKSDLEEPQAETWQDVLRRFAREQKAAAGTPE